MPSRASLPNVNTVADDISALLRSGSGARVQVTGPEGSGRSTLADALKDRLAQAHRIDLPAFTEPDAAAAILLSAASLLGEDAQRYTDESGRPNKRLAQDLAEWDGIVVIRAQGASPWQENNEHSGEHKRRLRLAIDAMATLRSSVWIVDGDAPALGPRTQRFALSDHRTSLTVDGWEGLVKSAEILLPNVLGVQASPVVWRLAVGAVHLGAKCSEVAARVRKPTAEALPELTRWIAGALQAQPVLLERTQRLLLARRPILRDSWGDAFGASGPERDLFTHVLGYGDPIRMNPRVRLVLAEALNEPTSRELENAHADLARVNATEDGVADPRALQGAALSAWVEKLHHLALGGDATQNDWRLQHKVWPDWYWERARHLSISRRDYTGAAAIYEECLHHFPDDPYAHHYYAWNLQRAKVHPERQRRHYARAVELDPANPWWNARRISQLIETNAWTEALSAWRTALDAIAPDGAVSSQLYANFHLLVARSWRKAGVWYEAEAILSSVPPRARRLKQKAWSTLATKIRLARTQERQAIDEWFDERASDPVLSERVQPAWKQIAQLIDGIPAPSVSQGEDGPTLAWSHPGMYLSIEFMPDGSLDWCARDRVRDDTGSGQAAQVDDIALVAWLRRTWHG